MTSGPVRIYVPRTYRRGQPGIMAFYDRLLARLDGCAVPHRVVWGRKAPLVRFPGRRYLTYHTHSERPVAGQLHLKLDYVTRYFTLDPMGYSGWSSLIGQDLVPDLAKGREVLAEYRDVGTKIAVEAHGAGPSERSIVVIGQVFDDTVAVFHRDWVEVFQQALVLGEILGCPVWYRPHPKDKGKLEAVASGFPGVLPFEGSFAECLSGHVLFVQNSGVGYEGLLSGAPVVAFGRSDYAFAAIDGTLPVSEIAEAVAGWDPEAALAAVGGMQVNRMCSTWSDARFDAALQEILRRHFGPDLIG